MNPKVQAHASSIAIAVVGAVIAFAPQWAPQRQTLIMAVTAAISLGSYLYHGLHALAVAKQAPPVVGPVAPRAVIAKPVAAVPPPPPAAG